MMRRDMDRGSRSGGRVPGEELGKVEIGELGVEWVEGLEGHLGIWFRTSGERVGRVAMGSESLTYSRDVETDDD